MSVLQKQIVERSGNACELCAAADALEQNSGLDVYEIPDSQKMLKTLLF